MNNIIKYATNEQLEALINNNSTLEAYEKYQYLTKEVKSIISMDNGVERDELLNQFLQDNEDFIEYNSESNKLSKFDRNFVSNFKTIFLPISSMKWLKLAIFRKYISVTPQSFSELVNCSRLKTFLIF